MALHRFMSWGFFCVRVLRIVFNFLTPVLCHLRYSYFLSTVCVFAAFASPADASRDMREEKKRQEMRDIKLARSAKKDNFAGMYGGVQSGIDFVTAGGFSVAVADQAMLNSTTFSTDKMQSTIPLGVVIGGGKELTSGWYVGLQLGYAYGLTIGNRVDLEHRTGSTWSGSQQKNKDPKAAEVAIKHDLNIMLLTGLPVSKMFMPYLGIGAAFVSGTATFKGYDGFKDMKFSGGGLRLLLGLRAQFENGIFSSLEGVWQPVGLGIKNFKAKNIEFTGNFSTAGQTQIRIGVGYNFNFKEDTGGLV